MKTLDEALQTIKLPFKLADLQVKDITELAPFERVGLFWDVGVGKTVAATLIAEMVDRPQTVIVMPPILVPQWKEWLDMVDPGKTTVYYGPKRTLADLDGKWVVTSHAIFRNDFREFQAKFLRRQHTTIVDEAQALKDIGSKLYRCVRDFSVNQPLILATATATSKPDDAYSYISLKTPKAYRSLGHFHNLHVVDRDFFGNVTEWQDLETISRHLMAQASKRTKEEVFAGSINPPVFQTIKYKLDRKHQKLYEQLVDECLLELVESGQKIDATTPQRLYHTTQQMVLNWAYFAEDPAARPAAFDILDQVIDETGCMTPGRSKLIVWSYYQMSSKRLLDYLLALYPGQVVAAYGGANSKASVWSFMNDDNTRILIGQPTSVGMGLNAMTVCNEALFLEFSTVPMHIRQSIGRIDRKGQEKIPNIRFAVAENTVQVRLLNNLFKNDDAVSVIERNPQTLRAALLGG